MVMSELEKTEAKLKQSRKNCKKEVFPFGNYKSYYGYRIGHNFVEDPRLKVFKKEWFEGKDCLDIGCNSGMVTIQIAVKFNCRSIRGIDIDSDRVDDAYWHLRKASKELKMASNLEVADIENGLEVSSTRASNELTKDSSNINFCKEQDLFSVVSFRQDNFISSHRLSDKCYDTILCLSVSKWIHLNWGDDGLITLFYKIWRLLRPGGMLIFEPQPWKSYESNYRVSETTAKIFKTIRIYPNKFQEILLEKIGFRTVEDLTSGLSSSKTGFNRPIFVFQK